MAGHSAPPSNQYNQYQNKPVSAGKPTSAPGTTTKPLDATLDAASKGTGKG